MPPVNHKKPSNATELRFGAYYHTHYFRVPGNGFHSITTWGAAHRVLSHTVLFQRTPEATKRDFVGVVVEPVTRKGSARFINEIASLVGQLIKPQRNRLRNKGWYLARYYQSGNVFRCQAFEMLEFPEECELMRPQNGEAPVGAIIEPRTSAGPTAFIRNIAPKVMT